MEWKKIIADSEKSKYADKLSAIGEIVLKESKKDEEQVSLMGGNTGQALFLFYYAKYLGTEKYYDRGMELLNDVFDKINDGFLYHTFSGGLAGVGWAVDHLIKEEFIDADSEELLGDLDEFLYKMMMTEIKNSQFDFLHGSLGVANYFLSRSGSEKTKGYLIEFVDVLEKVSTKDKDGAVKWKSLLDRDKGIEGYNLSLSHGISSIFAVLSKMYEQDINKDKVAALLEGAIKFLLKQSLDPGEFDSNFPSWVCEYPPASSRLAWCYGDLGNAIALWQAAQSTGNKMWEEKVLEIILHATKRRDIKKSMIYDAGLCHGGAGVSHIFNRMYHYTGKEECKDAAVYWFEHTLKMANHENGFAGYKVWRTKEYGGWQNETGFLEGVSGIGLAFLSAISDIEPRWDSALLMS
jgi:lantibiotic modifying enzyme